MKRKKTVRKPRRIEFVCPNVVRTSEVIEFDEDTTDEEISRHFVDWLEGTTNAGWGDAEPNPAKRRG